MGTLRGDNGGERPHDGSGVPGLPPEWGAIVIPDDAAELDHEAAALRREWRRTARRSRWRKRLRLPPKPKKLSGDTSPTLGIPLLIMTVAIIATLTSLFALAWPSRSTHNGTAGAAPASGSSALPDVTLLDGSNKAVQLRENLPAVILLVDGCDCGRLISAASTAAPASVTVLAVGRTAPPLPSPLLGHRIRAVADPNSVLRSRYASSTTVDGVVAVLVGSTGKIDRTIQPVRTVADFRTYLTHLG
ncbi:hypothetical protein GCM10023322_83570 [Rugosimonospora acidiphila]|uniref:Uncharacterized protein n=1 Tax=Rugosimonospora acidiphila TaxID=556531 RepID=A0ABP9SSW5_9ACTN